MDGSNHNNILNAFKSQWLMSVADGRDHNDISNDSNICNE